MSASPRDLLKPRSQRVSEVYTALQLQAGLADSQLVSYGCVLAPDATLAKNFAISPGEYVLAGQIVSFAGATAQAVDAGAATGAGQSTYVLIEADASGALFQTVGAIVSSGTPVLPGPTATRIALGYLAIPASFVPGTTALTAGECVTLAYSAGNVNPAGTQSSSGSSGGF